MTAPTFEQEHSIDPEARDVSAALAAGMALASPKNNPAKDGQHFVVVPQGFEVKELPIHSAPTRPVAKVRLRDVNSFVRYFNDHSTDSSRIYACMDPASFLAVFDDFDPSPSKTDIDTTFEAIEAQGSHRDFRAEFVIPASREWKTWTGADRRKDMSQISFATHIEDNMPDIIDPAGDVLYQIALNFDMSSSGRFVSAQRLQDGSHTLQWAADNNASGAFHLPETIKLNIPVFENGDLFEVSARIRYRLSHEGKLTIWYELIRPHKVLEAAFRQTWEKICDGCGDVILLGSPD